MGAIAALVMAGSLVFAEQAEIRGEIVRLGDVVDVSSLPSELRSRAAALPLARVRSDAPQASIPVDFLAAQARARMPVLAGWLAGGAGRQLTVRRPVPAGMPLVRADGVVRGEHVTVRVDAGLFQIEREGLALGNAHPGERLFVRTADRQVIAVRCVGSDQ